jgi:hypothetical protein
VLEVLDEDECLRLISPWAGGKRDDAGRITATRITGRRIRRAG